MAKESNGRADVGVRTEDTNTIKTQAEQALLAQQALEAELLKQKQAEDALLAKKEEEEEAVEGEQEAAPQEQAAADASEEVPSEEAGLTSVFADQAEGAENVMVAQSGTTASDAGGAADTGWGLGTWVAIGAGATAAVAFALSGDDDDDDNAAPVATNVTLTTAEDTVAFAGQLPATDADGDTLTYTIDQGPTAAQGTLNLNPDGSFTFSPAANFNGPVTIDFTVTDPSGATSSATLTINVTAVNDVPVAVNGNGSGAEDAAISGSLAGLVSDVDGDTLTFALNAQATNGTVTVNSTTGAYTYTPNANFNGNDSFTFTVSDGNGGTATATVNLTVTPVNDAPVASNLTVSATEDQVLNGNLPAATDVDGDTVTYALNTGAANGTVTVNANGSFIYVPNANFNGADAFTYTVSDGNGGSSTYTVNVNVANVNDAPVGANGSATTNEDVVLNGTLPVATDADNDTLTYALATGPANGTVVVNANGTYTYTPAANFNGSDAFTFTVSDGNGGTVTYTQSITVVSVNDAPVAQDQTLPAIEDTVLAGSVSATDVDGDTLTFSVAGGGVTAQGGQVVMQPNGSFTYTPAPGYAGPDSFTYTVSDGNGGTDTAVITLNVEEVDEVFTPGIDIFNGNAGDEVFVGANNNLNAGDSVNGGGGNDVVTHSVDGGLLNVFSGFIFNDVDVFAITSDSPLAATSTYDLSSSGPIGILRVENSTDNVVLNSAGAGATVANTTFLEILDQTSTTTDVSLDIRDIDVTGANDFVDVTVRSATNAGDALDDLNIDFAVETVTIHTDGPLAVIINDLNTDLGGAAGSGAVNLVLDAQDAALTITDVLTANVKNVDGSSSDENLTFSVAAANGNTTLVGGTGNDSITGSANADSVTAGDGNDTFNTGAGNDRIDMGAGNDVVNFTGAGNVSVQGGDGNDTINAGTQLTVADTITGGDGADLLNVGANNGTNDLNNVTQVERILLADINGNYNYTVGVNSAFAQDSTGVEVDGSALDAGESLNFNGSNRGTGPLTLIGGDGNDTLIGGAGNDVIVGDGDNGNNSGGDDVLQGGNGDEEFRFDGGELTAADRIHGGFSTDLVGTNRGNDTITLIQDGVNLVGGREVFVMDLDANASIELVKVEDGTNAAGSRITDLTVVAGHDQALTNVDATDLDSNEAFDFDASAVVNGSRFSVTSGAGADTLTGGSGNDTIRGGAGNDAIIGGAGVNQLFGEDGNDTLTGGASNDTLDGGAGNDSVDASQGGNDNVALGDGNDYANFGATGLTNNGGDTVAGGDGTDTVESAHNTPNSITDGAFANFSSVEVLNLTGNANSSTTLGANAQAGGIRTVNLNGAGNDVLNAGGFTADLLVNDNGGAGNDTITTGSGNDTVVTSLGDDSLVLNNGDDVVQISGTDLTFGDSIAAGAGSDKVIMDNSGGAVTAGVNLNNVTGLERYEFSTNGDRFVGVDADNNSLTFTGGNVLTVNTITIDASTLTDVNDSFTVTLDGGQLDADFRFEVFGSATTDTFVKDNVGTNNNILFDAGNGNDRLVIHGDDLGSTITMIGGGGVDAIQQTGGLIDDDGYDNVTGVEQLIAGGVGDRVNATLGAQAQASGLNTIIGGAQNDVVTFDAAFTTATTVDLRAGATGGNDSINAGMTTALITFLGQDVDFDANDTLVGGTSTGDEVRISATGGAADLTNSTNVETITILDDVANGADTSLLIDTNFGDVNGQNFQLIDASALDFNEDFVLTATGNIHLDVNSGLGNDTITTNTGNDSIDGGGGNDVINAGSGNNVVNGGAGNDSITVGNGNDSVDGGSGNDTIFGGNGLNTLVGNDGNDEITGGVDVDVIDGGTGNDQIFAGRGNNAGAGDTLTGGAGADTFYYVERADSSTSLSGRDTITDFQTGSDVIDFRYVTEAVAQYGAGALINFSGNAADFATAQGAITSGDNVLDVVYQQDNNVLWVDLNDDGVLNGNDLQIILSGVNTLTGADVLSGLTVGQTVITPGANIVGTILNETFTFDPAFGPGDTFTLDGAGGSDTIVIDGQDISTSSLSNVEVARIGDGTAAGADTATMTLAQHNAFTDIEDDGVGAASAITLTTGGTLVGDADVGSYQLANAATDFTLGSTTQNVTGGNGNDIIRTGAIDDVDGVINGGAGIDTLVVDSGDDLTGATVSGIEQTLVTLSSITITAAQHGATNGTGTLGMIVDAGDVLPNTTDTITIFDSTATAFPGVGITGIADIESYVLSAGDDIFTLGALGQNVDTGAGTNTVNAIAGALTGTLGGVGVDTLVTVNGTNISGADVTAVETIEINNGVTMTAAQHNAANVVDTDASNDAVLISTVGTISAAANIENYNLDNFGVPGGSSTINVNAATTGVNITGSANLDGSNVNVGGLTVTGAYTLSGAIGDTLTASNGADITGVNVGGDTTAETLSLTGGITLTQVQHEAFGDISAIGGADSATVEGAGLVTADADVETYNVSSTGANTVAVNAGLTSVDINGDAANPTTVNVGGLTVTGNYALANGADILNATDGADISGVNGGADTTAETITVLGDVTMTVAQHNAAGTLNGLGIADEITLADAGVLTGDASVETYELADGVGNVFTFGASFQNVFTTGSNNDVVQTGGQATLTGTLDLAANAGAPNDQLVVTGGDVDFSALNAGGETTAETLDLGNFNATMTEQQHDGFTQLDAAGAANTITLTAANGDGLVTGDADVETYVLNDAFTFTVGAAGQSVTGNGGNDQTVIVDGLTATGTLDGGAAGNDTLDLRNGADISGATISNFENLIITGAVSMTESQYESFGTITGGPGTSITITVFDGDGVLSIGNNVETYTFLDTGTVNVLAGAEAVDINGTAAQPLAVNVGGLTVTGDYALADATDVIIATAGADISGVNSGAATTAELINVTGDVTMTVAQHAAFVAANGIDAAGPTDQITLADSGTVDADADIETYVLGALGGSLLNVDAAGTAVDVTGTGGSDVINVDGLTVTGTYSLGGAADEITATTGADISGVNGGAATTAEQLNLTGIITMTVAQHTGFGTGNIVAGGGADEVILSDGGVVVVDADVEQYTSAFGGTFNLFGDSATATNVTSTAASADIISAGGQVLTGTYDLGAGSDQIVAQGGFDITGATLTAIESLRLDGAGTFTMTGDQYNAFTAGITDLGGDIQTIVLTTAAAGVVTADDDVENFTLQGGADSITFSGADAIRGGQSLDLTVDATADLVRIDNVTIDGGIDSALLIQNFATTQDVLQIGAGGGGTDQEFFNVNAAPVNIMATTDIIEFTDAGAVDLTDISDGGAVESLIADVVASIDAGTFTVAVESDNGVGVYQFTLAGNAADLNTAGFSLEHIATLVGTTTTAGGDIVVSYDNV
ncbi:Ig-like domain-containing protein [Flagellatimonas centrodinii]|uniref:tandem-95 repeat protein n=1 Tax=Flagellatimonas centrodinii TaxID=2806210 RepID=UPI001FEE2EB4|nr:Ig-like domain-containing protein [Flagellatimonas centrodinii]ULQ45279.1 Ig-like domain-containing protein [Flagellatimonas centrodinii]